MPVQYKDGTASVVNGSQTISGLSTAWNTDSNVNPGDLFTVLGDNVWYEIASVTNDTTLVLSANYAGTTGNDLTYAIHRDFSVNYDLPLVQASDRSATAVVKRAMNEIDEILKSLDDRITALEP